MVIISQILKPHQILDLLRISLIFSKFLKYVMILWRVIWRFMTGSADGWRGASWLWPSDGLGDPSLRWIQGEITWKRKNPPKNQKYKWPILLRSRFLILPRITHTVPQCATPAN